MVSFLLEGHIVKCRNENGAHGNQISIYSYLLMSYCIINQNKCGKGQLQPSESKVQKYGNGVPISAVQRSAKVFRPSP